LFAGTTRAKQVKIVQHAWRIAGVIHLRVIIAVAEHALIILGMGCASPPLAKPALTPLIALVLGEWSAVMVLAGMYQHGFVGMGAHSQ